MQADSKILHRQPGYSKHAVGHTSYMSLVVRGKEVTSLICCGRLTGDWLAGREQIASQLKSMDELGHSHRTVKLG